ncbi:MAG: hypothetical protein A2286_10460 [Gammaproteobacteria bacterium RIFOXYA12_FULL_61_12]|nr:MAG: hypothetical protein A2514_08580 [Gammaproteobacteria bacterium RIFOXYD12_FULL_61_37]OGT94655.1 MAG: hypothetical protein A2286_10460 [Gammaproteobacteria bacterium RIFOXYA12_FULL_61_12]
MRHIKKALSYSIAGSLGLTVIAALNGCGKPSQPPQGSIAELNAEQQQQNLFLVIKQTGASPDTYELVEKHPTEGPTRAILRDMNGTERFLTQEELKKIAEQEAAKVEAGSSRLTQNPSMHSGGLSLGETILAAAAGSLIGGMLANKLMGNPNYQQNQQRYGGGRPASTISRPASGAATGASKPRTGFFGGSSPDRSSSAGSSSFGG